MISSKWAVGAVCLAMSGIGCSNTASPAPAPAAQAQIFDAAHGSHVPGFWFLAPFVDVDHSLAFGTFASAANPTVVIDRVDASGHVLVANVATYTSASGPNYRNADGSEHGEHLRVHVPGHSCDPDADDGDADDSPYYYVRVDTDDVHGGLVNNGIYRAHVTAPVLATTRDLGFADILVVRSQAQARRVDTESYVPLVHGHALRIKFRIDTTALDACLGVTCTASDACHVAGTCNPGTGTCTNPNAANGTACTGTNACNQSYTCQAGVCTGAQPVVCTASDACHGIGTCDPATGTCSNPVTGPVGGTACGAVCTNTQTDLANCGACSHACAAGQTCTAGACVATCTPGSFLVLGTTGTAGNGNGQFNQPTYLAVDAAGNLYVDDSGNHRISVFTSSGAFVRSFGASTLTGPQGVAVDAAGNVYVADNTGAVCSSSPNYIQVFDPLGNFVRRWSNNSGTNINYGGGLAFASDGTLWVGNPFFAGYGCGQGVLTQDNAATGTQLASYEYHYGISYPSGVTVAPSGQVWYTDDTHVYQFAPTWGGPQTVLPLAGPTSGLRISTTSAGNLWITNAAQHDAVEVTPTGTVVASFGSAGTAPGQFNTPAGVVAAGSYVWVSDSANHTVTRYQASCP